MEYPLPNHRITVEEQIDDLVEITFKALESLYATILEREGNAGIEVQKCPAVLGANGEITEITINEINSSLEHIHTCVHYHELKYINGIAGTQVHHCPCGMYWTAMKNG